MNTANNNTGSSNKVDIADILSQGMSDYSMHFGNTPPKFKKVTEHICSCKTRALGGHVYQCNTCNTKNISYNSCRDRHCPKCQGIARAAWVDMRISELLPVGYFHVVFTVPDSFNGIRFKMKKPFYDILYRSASETLLELGRDNRWLGANIGFMAILHTWGQNLLEHPHLHCIVPGGGIRLDGKKWLNFRDNYLFPVAVMSELFRGKFLHYFSAAIKNKTIELPQENMPNGLNAFLSNQYKKDWVVYSKEPFGTAEQVVKYLGRYTHRIAISNQRLIKFEDDSVTFAWKDYADNNKKKEMTLNTPEFIRRYFLHILPDHFVRIRYFGILSNRGKNNKLNRCFFLLHKRRERKERVKYSIAAIILAITGADVTQCPYCRKGKYEEIGEILKIPDRFNNPIAA